MPNVIRKDVVQIEFDVGKMPFNDINRQMSQMGKDLNSSVSRVSKSFNKISSGAKAMKNSIAGISTDGAISSMRNDFALVDGLMSGVTKKANALKTTINNFKAHPIKSINDALLGVQMGAGRSLVEFKRLIKTKFEKLQRGLSRVKNELTQGQTGARGFVTMLKSIGKISVAKLYTGFQRLKTNITGARSPAQLLKTSLQDVARTSMNKIVTGVQNLGTKLKSALATAGKLAVKMGAVAAVAGAGAFGGLAVGSIKSYAEYEQLVGGVETLFKDSSKDLMKYADNAYKTAGMSANSYMDTVTSFSASMINSLGGDTAKAVNMSNMAITDMADNANKMGTDMESIQNAYQGFAKQNYTMLDNLKLGYGGTKEEMERLLTTAEKIQKQQGKNVDYSIDSFSDIVSAIHDVQTEMGIAGTTAKEAATTIQGSALAMKAAWTNFKTGMADSNQDITTLVDNLTETVVTFGKNVIPRIQTLLPRLASGLTQIITALAPQVVTAISELLPVFVTELVNVFNGLVSALQQNAGTIMQGGVALVEAIGNGVLSALPGLVSFITTALSNVVSTLPSLVQVGTNLLIGLAQGITNAIPVLIEQAPLIVQNLVDGITQALPVIIDAGIQLITMLMQGISQNLGPLANAALTILQSLITGITQNLPVLVQGALQIIMSLVQGLLQNLPTIINVGINLLLALIQGIVSMLPMIAQAAVQLIMGLAMGLIQNLPTIISAGIQIIVSLIFGLIQAIPQLLAAVPQIFTGFIQGILAIDWLSVGLDIIKAIVNGIWQGAQSLVGSVWSSIKGLFSSGGSDSGAAGASGAVSGLSSSIPQFQATGQQSGQAFTNGLTTGTAGATTAATTLSSNVTQTFTQMSTDIGTQSEQGMTQMTTAFQAGTQKVTALTKACATSIKSTFGSLNLHSTGVNIMSGLMRGMASMKGSLMATAQSIANSISSTINGALRVHSPSRVTMETGKFVGLGAIKGMDKSLPAVEKKSLQLGNAIATGTGEQVYSPETSTVTRSTRNENNSYAPVFNLTINGSGMSTRETERNVRQWVKEAVDEMASSINRRRGPITEV